MSQDWTIEPSACSVATINPIRNIVDKIQRPQNHPLPIIDLALGDPSVFGNLPPSSTVLDAMHKSVDNPKAHGYTNSMGVPAAREAVAKFMQRDGVNYAATDIAITSGASQALLLVVQLLCNPGDSILIPEPGFSHTRPSAATSASRRAPTACCPTAVGSVTSPTWTPSSTRPPRRAPPSRPSS